MEATNYEVLEFVAKGGMAEVWRACDRETGAVVALKFALPTSPMAERMFVAEAQKMAMLRHSAIAAIYDIGFGRRPGALDVDGAFIAMEWADQGTLLGKEIGSWSGLRDVALQILDALAYAHAKGVVHRDLKPANILVASANEAPVLKISDFGIAHLIDQSAARSEGLGSFAGTPAYMPPEQIRGRWRDFGPWTDLYALGCLLYEIASGRPPFVADNLIALAAMHQSNPPPPLKSRFAVPEGFEDWLSWLLEKRPASRPRTAADAAWGLMGLPQVALDPRAGSDEVVGAFEPTLDVLGELSTVADALQIRSSPTIPTLTTLRAGGASKFGPPPLVASHDDVARRAARVPGRPSLLELREPPFVGRDEALKVLWGRTLQAATAGVQVTLVTGAAGIGKSRLAHEVGWRAEAVGTAAYWHTSHSETDAAFGGVRRLLEAFARTWGLGADAIGERFEKVLTFGAEPVEPWRAHVFRDIATLVPDSRYVRSRRDVLRHFGWLVERVSLQRTLIVHLDDVRPSSDTLDVVRYVSENIPSARVHFVLTSRSASAVPRLAGNQVVVHLSPLLDKEAEELCDGTIRLSAKARERAIRTTAGDPLFLVHLLARWADGALTSNERGYEVDASAVPADRASLLRERLDGALGAQSDAVRAELAVIAAAILGSEVPSPEWTALLLKVGISPEDGWRLVESLTARGLARRTESGWAYASPVVRELLTTERTLAARAHELCADALSTAYGLDPSDLASAANHVHSRLARHLEHAGRIEEAVDAYRLVAAQTRLRLEYDECMTILRHREDLLRQTGVSEDHPRWAHGWAEAASCHFLLGELDRANELAEKVLASSARDCWTQVHILLSVLRGMNPAESLRHAEAAVDAAKWASDPALGAHALFMVAAGRRAMGDVSGAVAAFEACLRGTPRRRFARMAHLSLAGIHIDAGRCDEARTCMQSAWRLKEGFDDPMGDADLIGQQGVIDLLDGNIDEAVAAFRQILDLLSGAPQHPDKRGALALLAFANLAGGDIDEARACLGMAAGLPGLRAVIQRDLSYAALLADLMSDATEHEGYGARLDELEEIGATTGFRYIHSWLLDRCVPRKSNPRRQELEALLSRE